jgi:hypothetical protein
MRVNLRNANTIEGDLEMVDGCLGQCETRSDKAFMVIVTDRTAATLLPLIQRYILPGTKTYCHL